MAGSRPPPLQKSLSRRVSFNEATLRRHDDSDTESQTGERRRGRCNFCGLICNSCCFWISLILGLILFLLILLGSVYYAFLKSNLPDVRLQRLNVTKIDVVSTNGDTFLTANFTVFLNVTNESGKTALSYSSMTASVSSAGIDFGAIKLADVKQPPNNSMGLNLAAVMKNVAVEEAAAKELQDNAKIHMLVIDVDVRGKIDLFVGGKNINGIPFKIECRKIDQSVIEGGQQEPKCSTQLSPVR